MEKNQFFPEMNGKLGFGCMRFPLTDGKVDVEKTKEMVDYFLSNGFNYFDTAKPYHDGDSEKVVKEALTSRYSRDQYLLTDKLTSFCFDKEEDIRPLFEGQLKSCGVEYFDFYLLHAVMRNNYEKYEKANAFQIVQELKREGKIRHIGMSFHDGPELLEQILNEHPEIEVVQIQFNYADYHSAAVQSRKNYEILQARGIPALVMEPVKGGGLVNLPEDGQKVLDDLQEKSAEKMSNASFAIRFAASFPNNVMVLSGMGNMDMIQDNVSYMKDFVPLSEEEHAAILQVGDIVNGQGGIACTACRYCTAGCPKEIPIPDLFACYNQKKVFRDWNSAYYYGVHTEKKGKASTCIKCGKCEVACPQHLPIRDLLVQVADTFEKKEEE